MSGLHDSDFDEDDYEAEVEPIYAPTVLPRGREPLISMADRPPGAVQIRTQLDVDGRPSELGYLSIDATWFDVIERWHSVAPNGGTFHFIPVNQGGRSLVREPIVLDLSSGHEAYQKLADMEANETVASMKSSSPDAMALRMLAETQAREAAERRAREERELARAEAERKELADERRRLKESEERLGKERIALAAEAAAASNNSVQTILETAAAREDSIVQTITTVTTQANTTIMGFMTSMLQQQTAMAEAERVRRETEAASERERYKRDMAEAERRATAQRKADREDAQLRMAAEKAEFERSMERERAFHERMAKSSKGDDLGKLVAKGVAMAKTLGIDVQGIKVTDLLGMISGKGPASMMEMGLGIADKVVDGVIEVQKLQAANPPEEEEGQQVDTGLVDVTFPDGTVRRMTRAEYDQLAAQAQQQQQQIAQQPQVQMGVPPPPAQQPQQGIPGGIPGASQQGFTPPTAGFNPAAAGLPPTPPQAPQPPQAPPPTKNPVGHLPTAVQKKARKEVKMLAGIIRKHQKEQDDDVFSLAVMAEIGMQDESPELDAFIKAVGVDAGLAEAGLEPNVRNRIINLLAKSQAAGDFPADMPLRK